MQKLYCYVDETGKESGSKAFIVAVVIIVEHRDELIKFCEQAEKASGKGKFKWGKAEHTLRMKFLHQVFRHPGFMGACCYSVFPSSVIFDEATIYAIASAVRHKQPEGKFTTKVYVDGLTKTKRREYSVALRRLGLPVREVRGITRDESNAMTRLADTIAGFVSDALSEGSEDIRILFEQAQKKGVLIEG